MAALAGVALLPFALSLLPLTSMMALNRGEPQVPLRWLADSSWMAAIYVASALIAGLVDIGVLLPLDRVGLPLLVAKVLAVGAGAAVRAARRFLALELEVGESGAVAEVTKPLSAIALPDGGACPFYGAALAELLRLLTGFEGAMVHERCRGNGDDRCRWRATAVGGYD